MTSSLVHLAPTGRI